jgi:hypothetical protein
MNYFMATDLKYSVWVFVKVNIQKYVRMENFGVVGHIRKIKHNINLSWLKCVIYSSPILRS